MFKPKRQAYRGQPQAPNPALDMEQFYLNQYFQSQPNSYPPNPKMPPPLAKQNLTPPPPLAEPISLQQLESRLFRIEQYLGLSPLSPAGAKLMR